ncbi:chloride channel protein [Flavobacterium sp. J372]|uniref:chloride channel protein n=1 Tax=Flavobacterium sp. J372 TaxID=2898436 RepID=UPI002151507E|nr:chloride channel protein [Flavobacterium sp. J372]MCR5862177.1 chloride channel protein [Flavobacterium sp. J372]
MKITSRRKYTFTKTGKLLIASIVVALFAALLAVSLKHVTEKYEELFYIRSKINKLYLVIFPIIGLSMIYVLRQYIFKNKANKGITEVFDSTETGKNLPSYKIPSHFVNGLLTVIFGGSTGIEVSTVVSTAAIGSLAQEKEKIFRQHKKELICAGVTAGITALFNTPLAGLLFAYEVICRKPSKLFFYTNIPAAAVAWTFVLVLGEPPLFAMKIQGWHLYALPYFALLGVLAGLHSVYLTRCVIFCKAQFAKFTSQHHKILLGAVIISALLLLLPQLYGDGYHAIKLNILTANKAVLSVPLVVTLLGVLVFKPLATSITLSAGGDGGVFAPAIFIGAFLGLFTALVLNTVFHIGVIPLNFMLIGMGAMLSASIHAPYTALFLACGLVNDYTLFVPVLIACLIAKYTAKAVCPYTVYTFKSKV